MTMLFSVCAVINFFLLLLPVLFLQLYETQHRVVQAAVQVGHMMSRTTSQHGLCFAAIGSFLAWTDSYFILHVLNRRRSAEWNCRLVTVVHAVISTGLCLTSALIIGPWPFSHVGEPNTRLHTTIMVVSLGYFFFDFLWSLYMQTESNIMLAHHLVSILGFMYCLYTGRAGCELTAVMGASELTNPLLQLRWFLKETGLYRGWLAKIIDSVFVFLFLFCRLGVGTLFHYVCQTSPKLDLVSKGGGQAFYIISFVFGVQLVLFYYKKHIKKKL